MPEGIFLSEGDFVWAPEIGKSQTLQGVINFINAEIIISFIEVIKNRDIVPEGIVTGGDFARERFCLSITVCVTVQQANNKPTFPPC